MTSEVKRDLLGHLAKIQDPREEGKRKHKLLDILMMGLCAVLCGCEGFVEMEMFACSKQDWFARFLELPNGIPSHDTFGRVFSLISPREFEQAFISWTQSLREELNDIIALDGKTLRRSHDRKRKKEPLQMVSAWSCQNSLVLGQLAVDSQSNEITALPKLLQHLELEGCLLTADAIHCQKKLVKQVRKQKGDYTLSVKENQKNLYEEVKAEFEKADQKDFRGVKCGFHKEIDKKRGRYEERCYWMLTEISELTQCKAWKDVGSLIRVERLRRVNGKTSLEHSYYISSLTKDVKRVAKSIRSHWQIENKLHWVLDVQMNEDQSRIRVGYAAENMAHLRRMALNLLKKETTTKAGLKAKQKKAGWDQDYLLKLLFLFDN
jgi:predicted transposase YbfD/YdcC